jgi:outer membrane protein assembly factor BamE
MNPASIVTVTHRPLPRLLLLGALLGALLTLSAGCIYRPNIQQGNLLKVEDVDQVTVGMTRSQVRYLLGTPMISDPFEPERWDYVYTLKRGNSKKTDRAHFVVRFDGDKVSKVERPNLPGLPPPDKSQEKPAAGVAAPEAPPVPASTQAQPDAPPPSGT